MLAGVERLVGDFEDFLGVDSVCRSGCITERSGDWFLGAIGGDENYFSNVIESRQPNNFCGLFVGPGENQGEFFAAITGSHSFFAYGTLKGF